MIGIGLVGYGYWGPNLARNFAAQPDCSVVAICDKNPSRAQLALRHYPSARVTANYADLLSDPAIQAILVAVPVAGHFELARQALNAYLFQFVREVFIWK